MSAKRFRLASFVAAAAAPALSACSGGSCPPSLKSIDGRFVDFYADGGLTQASCMSICQDTGTLRCGFVDAGLVQCPPQCVGGRVPAGGFEILPVGSAGAWLARMAELEGAAVVAFEQLAAELTTHGLPKFAQAALQAALDEVRHATELTRLALGFGISPTHRRHLLTPLRSLEEVAFDNGGEGCGRELFGTLVNVHQAEHATDARVRATMKRVAADEASHARMSFALAEALMPRLTVAERRRVREAQEKTVAEMVREELPEVAARQLGLMDERALKATAEQVLTRARV